MTKFTNGDVVLEMNDGVGRTNPGFTADNGHSYGDGVGLDDDVGHKCNRTGPSNGTSDGAAETEDLGCFMSRVLKIQLAIGNVWQTHEKKIKYVFLALFIAGYFVYFGFALAYRFGDEGSIRLLWVTSLVVFGILFSLFWGRFGEDVTRCMEPLLKLTRRYSLVINIFLLGCIFVAVLIVLIVDITVSGSDPYNLVSLSGLAVYVILLFAFSYNPSKVKWRTVSWGFGLQFAFAMIILRWQAGYEAFKWLGDRVAEYLNYVNAGSVFLFGASYGDHFFAFQVLPTVIFISSTVTVLYYFGAMQWVIVKLAWVMQACMGTTAGESVNAAGNIFVGQTETPLMIRPLLPEMTNSEIHAVMTGGYATIAGAVMAAYILFGVPANHLISASVMSAPAALAIAKLSYPEVEKSKTGVGDVGKILVKSPESNFVEAAATGACMAIPLVANMAANLIAFIALLEFFNCTLTWFGDRVGAQQPITFQYLCSYVFWPFALVMGVHIGDCGRVAELIGTKTFINEFVAYDALGILIQNRVKLDAHVANNGTYHWSDRNDDIILHPIRDQNSTVTLVKGVIEDRSVVIATYALCGFSNISSIGIQIGAFSAMVPERKAAFSKIAVRAMIAGSVACFTTACVAGTFYREF